MAWATREMGAKKNGGLTFVLGFWETKRRAPIFPFTTLLEKLDTLEALEDGAFAADGGC